MGKTIIGLVEPITVIGKRKKKHVIARIDTGADLSSIDNALGAELRLGPVVKTKRIKSAHGDTMRPVILADILFRNKKIRASFTLADRKRLKYKVLVGKNILKKLNILIDPKKD